MLAVLGVCLWPVGVVALPLAAVVSSLALHDFRKMQAGTMDPNGVPEAEQAMRLCEWAALAGGVGMALGLLLIWFVLTRL